MTQAPNLSGPQIDSCRALGSQGARGAGQLSNVPCPQHEVGDNLLISRLPEQPKFELQEMWQEAAQHDWAFERLYPQAYRLFDAMVSTKEVLEDCFGHLAYRNKDNRNPLFMTVERLFFHAALSPRWLDQAWPRVEVQPGDLRNAEALQHARGKNPFLPSKHKHSETYAAVKEVVDAGGQRCERQ